MNKRLLSGLLVLCLIFTLLPMSAFADTVASGTCGKNLTWTLDSEGTLTISGEGKMNDFSSGGNNVAPWWDSIKNVIVNDGVTSIGTYAFYNCNDLTNVTIPSTVTSIGRFAFYNCSNLSNVTIPNSVTSIEMSAFLGCNSLTSIVIPDSVAFISNRAFSSCNSLTSITVDKGNKNYCSDNGVLFNKVKTELHSYPAGRASTSYIVPESVTSIGPAAFFGSINITNVVMSNSVTSIGEHAFYNCSSLTSVEIPNSVTSIGAAAFKECSSLPSVEIPNSVTSIEDHAFYNCSSLKDITLGSGVKSIGVDAFDNNKSTVVANVYYNGNIVSWLGISFASSLSNPCYRGHLFFNGKLVTDIVIPDGVTSIGNYAFYSCSRLNSVEISDSVTGIGVGAFDGCTSLTSITIPNSVTSIGDFAFFYCLSLTSITIPNSVTSIGHYAFGQCKGLTSVEIPDSVTSIGSGAFEQCNILASVTIPSSVTSIGERVFYCCTSLASVEIPDSVTSIGECAFSNCWTMKSVTIGSGITSIDREAFYRCDSLTDVYYSGTKEQWRKVYKHYDGNDPLFNAEMHYGAAIDLDTTDAAENDVVIASFGREIASGVPLDLPDCKLFKESGKNYKKLTGVTLARGGKTEENSSDNAYFVVPSAEVGDSSVKLSYKDYRDYIIPKDVMSSWSSSGDSISVTNSTAGYLHNAFMSLDKKDGKPYISTVFGCKKGGTYSEIRTAPLSVDTDDEFTIIVTAGGTGGKDCTYYLEQNADLKTQGSANGVFHENSLKGFKPGKKIYAYAKTSDGQVTEPIEVMLSIAKEPDLSPITDFVDNSTFAFLGKDCFKITIPEDIALFGGAEISLEAFKFPAGVEIDEVENTIKISIGANIWEYARELKDTSPTKYRQWEKECFKDWKSIVKKSTYTKGVDTAKDAKEKYKKIKDGFYEKWYGKDKFGNYWKSDKSQTFSVDTLAYFEFEVVNGELKLKDACGTIEGKFKFDYTAQGSVLIIPAYTYIEASAGLAVSSKWARYICDSDIPLQYNFSININPEVKLGAGAGVKDAASLGIYADATLPLQLDFFAPQHFTLDCNGEIGAECQLWIFKGQKKLLEGNLSLIDTYLGSSKKKTAAKKSPMLEQASKAAVELQVVSRDYLSSTSQWMGSGQNLSRKTRGVIRAEGMQLSTLQQSVFDNAQPQVVAFGNKLLMTWIQDASGRDDYNRMRLMYSVYDGSSWSEPAAVYDDGCNDNAPVLVSNGTDVFFAWQKLSRVLTTDDCDDIEKVVPLAEMYVAKYDASSNSITGVKRLTDDSVYDYSPCMTTENGNAVVYWASCDDNQMSTGTSNTIHKYAFGGTPTTVKSGLSYIIDMAASGSKLSFSTDTDGDTVTTADIAVRTLENGSLTEFEDPSDVNTVFTKCFYGKLNGLDTLFVSDMQNIYYVQDGSVHSVFADSRSISGNINYVADGNDAYILWTELGDVGNVVYSSKFENDAWSEPIQVSKTGTYLSNVDTTMYNGKLSGVCMSEILESSTTGSSYSSVRTDLCSFVIEQVQDVAVDSIHIEQKEIKKGQPCEFTTYVTNNGSETVKDLKFNVSDGLGFSNVTEVSTEIASGATVPVYLSYTAPSNYGQTELSVTVECSDIDDSNSENDSASIEIGTPQITMTEGEICEFDDSYIISALVTNESDVAAENVQVSALLNSVESEPQSTDTISLGARETAVMQFTVLKKLVEFDEARIGNIFFTAGIDSENQYRLGVAVSDVEAICEHSITADVEAVAATCTEGGKSAGKKCLGCGEIVSGCEETAPLGHDIVYRNVTAATCTESGSEIETCTRCDDTTYKEIPALGHSYKNGTCTRCGEKDPNYVAAPVIKITTSAGKPKISWSKVDGAVKYQVYYSTDGKKYYQLIETTKTSVTHTKAKIGTKYYYKVKVVNAGAESEFSNVESIKCRPAAPTVTISRSGGKAKLSWKAVSGATKYYVYRSTDGVKYKPYYTVSKTSFTDSKSASGTKYYYKVMAVAVVNETNVGSACSAVKSITTTLAKPTVKITTVSGKPKLSWSKVTGADKYYVYRSTNGKDYTLLVKTTKMSVTNTGAKKGTKYYYKVKAICSANTNANSAFSAVVSIKATK